AIAVTSVSISPTSITITNGSTTTLTGTIAPVNATNQNVTWSSDNTSVATVNNSGVVTSVGVGDAKITVTTEDGGFTATSLVTVEAAAMAVTSVSISPTSITITNGSTTTLTGTIAPANATNQNVTWSSDNTGVATVNASGVVTSVGVGDAKITVTTEDGGFTATSLVTVEAAAIAVTSVSISPTSITITNGSTTTLTGTIAPVNATNQNVTWSSDNTSVATVNASGVVTSLGVGDAKITVTTEDGGFTATSLVTVEDDSIAVTSVSISPTAITITNGSTTTLTGTIAPTNATNQNVTWSSSNTSLATVNATGLVTGVGVGSAIITITTEDGNFFANSLITVNTPPIPVTSVSVDPLSIMITEGNTTMLNEIILPANATDKDVTWSSDDITVAIVDASGVVTGVGVGTAIITVTTDDGNKTATSNITVEAITVTLPNVTVGINQIITLPTNSVTLTGSATDSDGIATYTWTKISGGGSTIVTPTAASTLVTGLLEGTYIFRLTATDNLGSENFAEVEVIVNPAPITLPTVNAGSNQTITLPTNSVMLAGSATDADGISTYAWTKINGGIATIVTPSDASTSITSLVAGAYIFRLTATDNLGSENFAEVEVIVNPAPITLPTVNAGSNQTITLPTNSVMLVGSATDADGISTYAWTKISGGIATIVIPSAESTSITGLIAGTYTFRLTATDNLGSQNFAEVDVIVKPQPAPSVTFDPTTGVYTAPAGSTVTVNLTTQGVGKGNAWVNIVEISSNINTSWNGLEDEMFLESDTDSFIMPASGVVTFEGNHFDTFNLS
ncbi:Ig domain-containing protein, partial [Cellulophaga sp. Z1A5H]|uniref:Ig-like domain-containing protein n=1 Tax=Cellulophaga sp. Z1A5H TaxID=2687291 RepID=UPI0013FD111F